jgi:PKD repeat protein
MMNRNKLFIALSLFVFLSFYIKGYAQSLGDPVVHITFGAGTTVRGGALSADSGATTYTYTNAEIGENYYTITNLVNTAVHAQFVTSTDHTGNTGGYMMVVNGNLTAGTVFTRTVPGLCGTTTYQFGVWVKNVLASGGILPNMVFHIYAADGVTELGTGVPTGDVPTGNVWHNYTANFTLPAGTGSVVIKLVSNASGQQGNDFAVDDITFSPYGSTVSVAYDQTTATTQTTCAGTSQTYTINATSTLGSGYVQKLQAYINGVWVDQGVATTQTSFQITPPATAGTYLYRLVSAIADNINSASCVVASNQLTLNVTAGADASFTSSAPNCFGDATTFTALGTGVSTWAWNFGDNTPVATTQNPSHTYAAPGDYSVTLIATNSIGCSSTVTQTVHISALPKAAFNIISTYCDTKDVTFDPANSIPGDGTTLTYNWDFGDGNTITRTNNSSFTLQYAQAGTYTVTLTVTNINGCTNKTSATITIHPLPVADFSLPDVCLADASAQFTNNSTIADGSAAQLIYNWNFGDPNATAANNTSALANPSHKYSAAANYTVMLTVASKDGCSAVTVSKTLTVNGAVPVAGFTVASSLCSSNEVVFTNSSTVDFGNITKMIWYFDYDNEPTVSYTYLKDQNQIPADNIFTHNYGLFYSPATKNYHVKLVVYSGGTCTSTFDKTITIKASPQIKVAGPATICQGDNPVQFTAENVNGLSGTGIFSGTGTSAAGLFNPATAGPGKFDINYLFTANSGCTYDTTLAITVYANPKVSMGNEVTVLEGGQAQLNPTVSGTEPLTYKWTLANGATATGLNHDDIVKPTVILFVISAFIANRSVPGIF